MNPDQIELFLGLPPGSFDHIPHYCKGEALEAIAQVRRLEISNLFRPGVYYIALMDLCDSTTAAHILCDELHAQRIQTFVTAAVSALGESYPQTYSHFIKQTGDAVLMIFSSFHDLYHWWTQSHESFRQFCREWKRQRNFKSAPALTDEQNAIFEIRVRTVIHVGEVTLKVRNDPVSEAVNQVFKIEKMFGAGQLGATQHAFEIASPFFHENGIAPEMIGNTILPGHSEETNLWLLAKDEYSQYPAS